MIIYIYINIVHACLSASVYLFIYIYICVCEVCVCALTLRLASGKFMEELVWKPSCAHIGHHLLSEDLEPGLWCAI
jgi:hypothetical protein